MSSKPAHKGHTKKHSGTTKHHGTGKHHPVHHKPQTGPLQHPKGGKVHTVAKHPHHAKPRGLALGDLFPVCAVQAVAQSLAAAGGSVSPADVLALHRSAGGTESRPVSLGDALAAVLEHGLAGHRPLSITQADPAGAFPQILGVELPGAHAVLATAGTWWSWGEPWCPCEFPDAVVEEAWAVRWPACL